MILPYQISHVINIVCSWQVYVHIEQLSSEVHPLLCALLLTRNLTGQKRISKVDLLATICMLLNIPYPIAACLVWAGCELWQLETGPSQQEAHLKTSSSVLWREGLPRLVRLAGFMPGGPNEHDEDRHQ